VEILKQLSRWENCQFTVANPETKKPFVQLHKAFDNARKATGLKDVRVHDLRHTCASFMINQGQRSIYEVAKVEHFSEVFEKTKAEAALAAGIVHRKEVSIEAVKQHMRERGIETR